MVCAALFSTLTGWHLPLCSLLVGVVGGIVGSIIFAAFLFVVFTLFGWNSTRSLSRPFATRATRTFCVFTSRRRQSPVYPIGIDKICRKWQYDHDNASDEASWLKPSTGTIEMRLIEQEFTIPAPPQENGVEIASDIAPS